jgi:hypothetical protein
MIPTEPRWLQTDGVGSGRSHPFGAIEIRGHRSRLYRVPSAPLTRVLPGNGCRRRGKKGSRRIDRARPRRARFSSAGRPPIGRATVPSNSRRANGLDRVATPFLRGRHFHECCGTDRYWRRGRAALQAVRGAAIVAAVSVNETVEIHGLSLVVHTGARIARAGVASEVQTSLYGTIAKVAASALRLHGADPSYGYQERRDQEDYVGSHGVPRFSQSNRIRRRPADTHHLSRSMNDVQGISITGADSWSVLINSVPLRSPPRASLGTLRLRSTAWRADRAVR